MPDNTRKNRSSSRHFPASHHRQLGILGRIFKGGGLDIEIKNQAFSFDNVEEFRQFLSAKTEIPASKLQEMLKRSDQHLAEEIKQLRQIENTINEKLAATIRDPKSIDNYLDDATMVRFSQDYDWRQIMFELSKKSTDFSEYKLEAVTYYMKYLHSRIDMADSVLMERGSSARIPDDKTKMAETLETKAMTDNYSDYIKESPGSDDDGKKDLFISTGVLDLDEDKDEHDAAAPGDRGRLVRIPRGKTVRVNLESRSEVPMKLASRRFVLLAGDDIELVSKNNERYKIQPGENLIGRSTKCSIVLNPEFVDISRQHMIIELYPDRTLHFTDLSSSGCMLPENVIES